MAGSALQVAVDVFVGTDSFQIDQSNAVIEGVAQQVQLAEAAKLGGRGSGLSLGGALGAEGQVFHLLIAGLDAFARPRMWCRLTALP